MLDTYILLIITIPLLTAEWRLSVGDDGLLVFRIWQYFRKISQFVDIIFHYLFEYLSPSRPAPCAPAPRPPAHSPYLRPPAARYRPPCVLKPAPAHTAPTLPHHLTTTPAHPHTHRTTPSSREEILTEILCSTER